MLAQHQDRKYFPGFCAFHNFGTLILAYLVLFTFLSPCSLQERLQKREVQPQDNDVNVQKLSAVIAYVLILFSKSKYITGL